MEVGSDKPAPGGPPSCEPPGRIDLRRAPHLGLNPSPLHSERPNYATNPATCYAASAPLNKIRPIRCAPHNLCRDFSRFNPPE